MDADAVHVQHEGFVDHVHLLDYASGIDRSGGLAPTICAGQRRSDLADDAPPEQQHTGNKDEARDDADGFSK
jgi:hypothetical protein